MQRAQKQNSESANSQRTAQAKFTSKSRENERANGIDDSPAMIAQRKKLNSLFGGAIQRVEDEEPLQGKFETAQRVEEEEPLQGKFDAAQRVEEEEPLQGKFEAVQRVKEEEPLQGKFETAQRVEEEEPLQGKFEAVQRVEEDEPLQGKFETAQRVEEEEPLQGKFAPESAAQLKEEPAAKSNNTGLPDNLKSGIESLSGMSMDNVKVHYNSSQPAQLNALAYAQGTDIHVAPGQEQHLPHEAWHVVQQAQGRVKPTMQMKEGVPVNDDKSLEHEADVMGAMAAQRRKDGAATQGMTPTLNQPLIQCYLTRAESAAGDVLHRDRADIFEQKTLDKYGTVARRRYPTWGDKVTAVKNAIEADRDLDYKRMSSDTLTSYADARSLVGDNREHMYVHVGGGIYRGDRTNEKLPHPALYGYDPDVDGAGTLRATFSTNPDTLRVKVTNSSGHFRPPSVDEATREKVEAKVRNGKPRGTRVFVDIQDQ